MNRGVKELTGFLSKIDFKKFVMFFVGGFVVAVAFYFFYSWFGQVEYRYWEISLDNPLLYFPLAFIANLVYAYYKSKRPLQGRS